MKQVVAIIKPFVAEKVISALAQIAIDDVMIREVKGYGRQKNYLSNYEENEFSVAFLPKVEINAWVEDQLVDDVVDAIQKNSRTGRMGDGKILVLPSWKSGP